MQDKTMSNRHAIAARLVEELTLDDLENLLHVEWLQPERILPILRALAEDAVREELVELDEVTEKRRQLAAERQRRRREKGRGVRC